MKTRLLCALVTLLLSSNLSAAPIELGASVQLTGQFANTGRYYGDAYQFAVDKINAAGGVKVDNSREKLSLKILDSQSDVNLSVRQYVQLVSQDKINFLLGPFASDFALADSAISEKYNVPMIQGGGASDQIFSRGYKFIFGTLPPATDYFQSTIDLMSQLKPAPTTVAWWSTCSRRAGGPSVFRRVFQQGVPLSNLNNRGIMGRARVCKTRRRKAIQVIAAQGY